MKKGFTILELLVVIVIIGILASLTFVALNGVRAKARDTKRVADIRQIQSALEMYKNDNGVYPQFATSGRPLVFNGQTYMSKVPTAPGTRDGSCTTDSYTYQGDSSGTTYGISYCLGGAVNNAGPGAGVAMPGKMFVPPVCPATTTTDVEGNVYNLIAIGEQCWFKQNLKTTKFRDGTPITQITDDGIWSTSTIAAYDQYHDTSCSTGYTTAANWGRLYNWYAINDTAGLCPSGWHIPSDDEFKNLMIYLGYTPAQANTNGWIYDSQTAIDIRYALIESGACTGATNSSGFTSKMSGLRYGYMNNNANYKGKFKSYGFGAYYWTSTTYDSTSSWWVYVPNQTGIARGGYEFATGMSARCLKD